MRRALLPHRHILKLHMTEDKKALQNKASPPPQAGAGALGKKPSDHISAGWEPSRRERAKG